MIAREIGIGELSGFIENSFLQDEEITSVYDKNAKINDIADVCEDVYEKIKSLHQSPQIRGVYFEGSKIGYFVFMPGILISFGININYRNNIFLVKFWDLIKEEIKTDFQCYLFDYNIRAIQWLKKCGMNILFENVTILQLCH